MSRWTSIVDVLPCAHRAPFATRLEQAGQPWQIQTSIQVMAMAHHRQAHVLTWNFRHFRAVVLERGHHWPLVVTEAEMPLP